MGIEDDKWRQRLADAVGRSGRSMREVSLAARLGHGYVYSILAEGKSPSIENMIRICDELKVTLSSVLYGIELTSESQEWLQLLQAVSPAERRALLDLLKSRPAPESNQAR